MKLVLLFGFTSLLYSQSIDVSTAPNFNSLYASGKDAAYETSYSNHMGFTFGIGVEKIKMELITLSFTLSYDSYGGEIYEMRPVP